MVETFQSKPERMKVLSQDLSTFMEEKQVIPVEVSQSLEETVLLMKEVTSPLHLVRLPVILTPVLLP